MERENKKIVDLKPGDKGFNITVQVVSKEKPRAVEKLKGKKVTNAVVKDDTGEIAMTLWGKDSEEVKEGEFIRVENGLVGDWMKKPELTAGKFGKVVRLD